MHTSEIPSNTDSDTRLYWQVTNRGSVGDFSPEVLAGEVQL